MTGNHRPTIGVFDGHNDTVLSLRQQNRSFFERSAEGHIDLPRAGEGGLVGGIFAVWVPDPSVEEAATSDDDDVATIKDAHAAVSTRSARLTTSGALREALPAISLLHRLARESNGRVTIVRTWRDLRTALDQGVFAMQLHLEGAEPIDPALDTLDAFYAAGMRSLGIVWSRPNAFGHGVPFVFPGSPDTGPGLTDAGKALVAACNQLGIMLDVSHLNAAGFWDVVRLSTAPIVASHSCAHAISPSARNLTDKQLDAIRDSNGLVGINFHVGFLRPDGRRERDTPLSLIADHIDYIVERVGIDKVALGSDFDGATMPAALGDVAGLPRLIDTLRERGYNDASLRLIGTENWLRVLAATWQNGD